MPPTDLQALPRIVILGGGFVGIAVAQSLGRSPCAVTLIDRQNVHLFAPLLYQAATAVLPAADIAQPLRRLLARQKNVDVLLAEVTGIDAKERIVATTHGPYPYDILVIATGSRQSYFGHDDWADHATSLKSARDAVDIRNKVLLSLEQAEWEADPAKRAALATIVLVGGGPTGIELAGSLIEMLQRTVRDEFRKLRPEHTRVILVEGAPRLLGAFPESLASYAEGVLRRRGVELRLGAPVVAIEAGRVRLPNETIEAATILWTAGVAASPAAGWLGVQPDRAGRIPVSPTLLVYGHPDIYCAGDTALALDVEGKPLPGLAQVARQQGLYIGRALRARLAGDTAPVQPFRFRDYGNMATIGRNAAVADFGRWRVRGFIAWLLWCAIHVALLNGFRNRVLVTFRWLWDYAVFQRGARLISVPPVKRDG